MAKRKAVTDKQLIEACLAYGRAYLDWTEKHGPWYEVEGAGRHVWWVSRRAAEERRTKNGEETA